MRGDGWGLYALVLTEPSITFDQHTLTVAVGETAQIGYTRIGSGFITLYPVYSPSSKVSVGLVPNENAVNVRGQSAGTATVRISMEIDGQTYSDTCAVTVTSE